MEQNTEEEANALFQLSMQQLQQLALSSSKCSLATGTEIQHEKNEKIDNELLTTMLRHKLVRDFFVASKIEEEITRTSNDEGPLDPTKLLLNQALLLDGLVSVFQFLVDAGSENLLSTANLVKLIEKCRGTGSAVSKSLPGKEKKTGSKKSAPLKNQKEMEVIQEKDESQSDFQPQQHHSHHLSFAAANAISILNSMGYDFKGLDFSGICFAGANLINGRFERTNFAGADLQGVNFSDAWLKDTSFVKANMSGVDFGIPPVLTLNQVPSQGLYSPTGKDFPVTMKNEILVFREAPGAKQYYQEFQRLKGHRGDVTKCSFSGDGQSIVSGGEDGTIRIWKTESGECVQVLKGHTGRVRACEFSQDGKQIVSVGEDQIMKKWVNSADGWTLSFQLSTQKGFINCGFVPNSAKVMFVVKDADGVNVYHSVTGKYLRKSQQIFEDGFAPSCQLSTDGKQMVIMREHNFTNFEDCIRGTQIKLLSFSWLVPKLITPLFVSSGIRLFVSSVGRTEIWDTANVENLEMFELRGLGPFEHFSHNPIGNGQIAMLSGFPAVLFNEIKWLKSCHRTIMAKGNNSKRLNLTGTIIDDCLGLSDENIVLFSHNSNYKNFGKQKIQELILNNRTSNLEKITEVNLSGHWTSFSGLQVIARNTKWVNLERLDLSMNNLEDKDAVELASNLTWKNLQELRLNSNQLARKAAAAIATNPCWKNLKRIYLESNKIGNHGAKAIGNNLTWENLEELVLSLNDINEEGAIAIGQNKSWKQLKKLDLSINSIGNRGAGAIARNKTWQMLRSAGFVR